MGGSFSRALGGSLGGQGGREGEFRKKVFTMKNEKKRVNRLKKIAEIGGGVGWSWTWS